MTCNDFQFKLRTHTMNKILELLMDDYHARNTSAEYKLMLAKVCAEERVFMESLNVEQRRAYLKYESVRNELDILAQNELAVYLFENF